jgi:homocysteine S-methyltransferase
VAILTCNTYSISTQFAVNRCPARARNGLSPAAQAEKSFQDNIILARAAISQFCKENPWHAVPLLVASIGSYGTCIPKRAQTANREGEDGIDMNRIRSYGVDSSVLYYFHKDNAERALKCGMRILAFETVSDLVEAQMIARVLDDVAASWNGVEAWVAFTCGDDTTVDNGDTFADCVCALKDCATVVAMGVNCTAPHLVPALLRVAKQHTSKPLVAYPNSGETYLMRPLRAEDGEMEHWKWNHANAQQTGNAFAEAAVQWHDEGAKIIGGCCRVTASDIAALQSTFAAR